MGNPVWYIYKLLTVNHLYENSGNYCWKFYYTCRKFLNKIPKYRRYLRILVIFVCARYIDAYLSDTFYMLIFSLIHIHFTGRYSVNKLKVCIYLYVDKQEQLHSMLESHRRFLQYPLIVDILRHKCIGPRTQSSLPQKRSRVHELEDLCLHSLVHHSCKDRLKCQELQRKYTQKTESAPECLYVLKDIISTGKPTT